MITAALVAIAYNIYLADKSDYLEFRKKVSILPALIFAVLIILTLIAFAFYWGFKKPFNVPRTNPNNPDVIYSKYSSSVKGFNDKNFEVVDLEKVYGGNVPTEVYLQESPYSAKRRLQ